MINEAIWMFVFQSGSYCSRFAVNKSVTCLAFKFVLNAYRSCIHLHFAQNFIAHYCLHF